MESVIGLIARSFNRFIWDFENRFGLFFVFGNRLNIFMDLCGATSSQWNVSHLTLKVSEPV